MIIDTRLHSTSTEQFSSSLTYSLLIALTSLLLLMGCAEPPAPILPEPEPVPVDSVAIKAAIQHEQDSIYTAFFVQQYIDELLAHGKGKIRGVELYSDVMLPNLYEACAYQLLWKDSLRRENALTALKLSTLDGLEPEDYHLSAITDLMSLYADDPDARAGLDLLITDGIILYGSHLLNGKTDPNALEPTLRFKERVLSDEVLEGMRTRLIKGDVQGIIEDLRPASKYYKAMMVGLKYYESLADSSAWKPVYLTSPKLVPGEVYPEITVLRARMLAEGDLLKVNLSTIQDSTYNPQLYDQDLLRAVERFQTRHGLNPDGVVGAGTIKSMNITAKEKVRLLKANLERARWIHHDLDSNFILVNIAGFDLRLVKHDTICWSTKVMTGKVATATPVFIDEMLYVEFNPYWTVPFSISNGEILPILKKDPRYLSRNNMELLTMSGSAVNESGLDYSTYQAKLPYIIRQGPGPGNSLGRVKFLFPNKFSVYLHDTPSRSLFSRETRAFSHGCIRVEDPLKLAEYVLMDENIKRSQIDSIIDTKKNFRVDLSKPLPVIITYNTAFADDDLIYFYGDVYKRDQALMRALGL